MIFQCLKSTIARRLPSSSPSSPPTPILTSLSLTLKPTERWAVIGRVGSGKTTLGEALSGLHSIPTATWFNQSGAPSTAEEVVGIVSFSEESKSFGYSGRGLHERYASYQDPDDITLADYLLDRPSRRLRTASVTDAPVVLQDLKNVLGEDVEDLMDRMGISETLLGLPLLRLSNGQMRRGRILKTVVGDVRRRGWRMVVLDEPFMGLDVQSRFTLSQILSELPTSHNTFLSPLLLLRPQDPLPPWITHLAYQGPKEGFAGLLDIKKHVTKKEIKTKERREAIVEMEDVKVVTVEGGKILDGISWRVEKGERWALSGPNGSGKTTLLSLLVGDHPQSFSNILHLFSRRRGTGESIWDIKRRIGHVSPELHMHFVAALRQQLREGSLGRVVSNYEVVASGLDEAGRVRKNVEDEEMERVKRFVGEVMGEAGKEWGQRGFFGESMGGQRFGLILRASNDHPLLSLDEPFQGLDETHVELVHAWLRTGLSLEQALVFVTHHVEEIPDVVDCRIEIEKGRVVKMQYTFPLPHQWAMPAQPYHHQKHLTITTYDNLMSCFQSFPVTHEERMTQITALMSYFAVYPFLNLAKSSNPPLHPSRIDIIALLKTLPFLHLPPHLSTTSTSPSKTSSRV
ncbi:P-loop containing nucleoside triphosphate hydrolase protein [Chytridium lagenaria]|nr:P-loop containing nucleoside triphosphate hydrolase protein [Chytridium lagenaria]